MSDRLGMVEYGGHEDYVFLGREMSRAREYSEATAQDIDREVRRIVDEAYARAKSIILQHRDKIEKSPKASSNTRRSMSRISWISAKSETSAQDRIRTPAAHNGIAQCAGVARSGPAPGRISSGSPPPSTNTVHLSGIGILPMRGKRSPAGYPYRQPSVRLALPKLFFCAYQFLDHFDEHFGPCF